MSVEGGSIGTVGVGVSMGPGIGSFAGAGVEAGLSARFGPSISGPDSFASLPAIVESPVSLADFKNTMPLQLGSNQVREIKFNDKPFTVNASPGLLLPQDEIKAAAAAKDIVSQAQQPLKEADVVAGAEAWLGLNKPEAQVPLANTTVVDKAEQQLGVTEPVKIRPAWSVIVPQVEPGVIPLVVPGRLEYPKPRVAVSPIPEPAAQVENTDAEVAQSALPQPVLEDQEVEEEIVKEVKDKKAEIIEEEVVTQKKFYVVDERAQVQRIFEIRQAVKKAEAEAERLGLGKKIIGKLVAKQIPAEHAGNRSQIVQPQGPDGSYEKIREAIELGQFGSEEEVQAVVSNNRPVKIGENGEPVSAEEVRKVDKGRFVKRTNQAIEIVLERRVKIVPRYFLQ